MNTVPSRYKFYRWLPLLLLLLAPANVLAMQGVSVTLKGDAEVPPVSTMASGSGQISVQPDRSVMGRVQIKGINATMAHIHIGEVGKNGPVVVPLAKSGDDSFEVPPGAMLTEEQYASFKSGQLYVNVHSTAHPGGEIRGQLLPEAMPMKQGY